MSLKFSLLIAGHAYSSQSADTALKFAEQLILSGHELYRVFFFHDGVHAANTLLTPPQDEESICKRWQQLQSDHQLDLCVCISSALRRGIINEQEAQRYELPAHNLAPGFSIGGLGQWVDACLNSDRTLRFGG